jgi:hypothetical protein
MKTRFLLLIVALLIAGLVPPSNVFAQLTASPTPMAFGNNNVMNVNPILQYTLSGATLTGFPGNITVTAPTGFMVSLTTSGFASSVSVAYSSATLAATTVYVMFSPTSASTFSGNISNAGGGAATINVAVSGSVSANLNWIRSTASGNWSTVAWEATTDGGQTWSAASTPAGSENILIQDGHIIIIDVSVSITGYLRSLNTGTSQATSGATSSGSTTVTLSASNARISVGQVVTTSVANAIPSGTTVSAISTTALTLSAATTAIIPDVSTLTFTPKGVVGSGHLTFANGSTYEAAGDGGPIPTATWNAGSTCLVTGANTLAPANANQSFANFTWDCSGQNAGLNVGWSGNTIGGNITCNNTNGQQFRWTSNTANGGSAITITVNGNIVVNNAAIMSPTSSGNALVYTINQTGSITVNGTGQLYVCGTSNTGAFVTWYVTGGITTSSTAAMKSSNTISRWTLNSTGTQNVSVGGTGVVSSGVIVEVANGSTVQLNSSFTVNRLVLTSGKIVTSSSNKLTIGSVNSVTGGSATAYVEGPMVHQYNVAGAQTFVYPIAKGGIYRPVTLALTQSATTTSNYTVEMFNSTPSANSLPGTLGSVSTPRYYTISEGGGGSAFTVASVILNYGSDDGVTDNTNLRVAKNDGVGNWVDLGGSGSANSTGHITSGTAFTDLTGGTTFVLANNLGGSNPLPVELASFTGSAHGRSVELLWNTATEINNNGFEVQRAMHSGLSGLMEWQKIGFVDGAGTSNVAHSYSYADVNSAAATYSYRLKQIDHEGKFTYSSAIEVTTTLTADDFKLSQNYPNPFNPSTKFSFAAKNAERTTVKIFNVVGQEVATLFNEVAQPNQIYTMTFDARNLPSGTYFYVLHSASRNEVRKMMLLK